MAVMRSKIRSIYEPITREGTRIRITHAIPVEWWDSPNNTARTHYSEYNEYDMYPSEWVAAGDDLINTHTLLYPRTRKSANL